MSRVPASVLALINARSGGRCELCGKRAQSTQHRKPRGMGGSKDPAISTAANLLRLCGDGSRGCHGLVESHRDWAYQHGLLVRRSLSPIEVPVLLRHGWVLLTEDGQYEHVVGGAA